MPPGYDLAAALFDVSKLIGSPTEDIGMGLGNIRWGRIKDRLQGKGLTDEQMAARDRLKLSWERDLKMAAERGHDISQYLTSQGWSEKGIADMKALYGMSEKQKMADTGTPKSEPKNLKDKEAMSGKHPWEGKNSMQKKALIAVAVVIFLMLLFPPYLYKGPYGIDKNAGYGWLFNPPKGGGYGNNSIALVNTSMLLAQWIGVLLIGAITIYLFKNKNDSGRAVNDSKVNVSSREDEEPPV